MKPLIKSFTYGIAALMLTTACNDTLLSDYDVEVPADYLSNKICFSSAVMKQGPTTRGDLFITSDIKDYKPLPEKYELSIRMVQKGTVDAPDGTDTTIIGTNKYIVNKLGSAYTEADLENNINAKDGYPTTLKADGECFYWPSSTLKYAFIATAGATEIPTEQDAEDGLITADRLLGYAATTGKLDTYQHLSAKDWYKGNGKVDTIPLYLKHQCGMISIILEPGEGVKEAFLKNSLVGTSLVDTIFSYTTVEDVIQQLAVSKPHHEVYELKMKDEDGNDQTIETTMFTAIVEPFDYASNTDRIITRISIHGQRYSFYSTNDSEYVKAATNNSSSAGTDSADNDSSAGTDDTTDESSSDKSDTSNGTTNNWQEAYNVKAGDHLVITVKVGRDGRIIEVFAQKKDWVIALDNDFVTDDFGRGKDPVLIHRGEHNDATFATENSLEDFLNNTLGEMVNGKPTESEEDKQNAKGVIAILNNNIELTKATADKLTALNAVLNLNGYTLTTSHTLFTKIADSGILKNGKIAIVGDTIDCPVGAVNEGSIEKITVVKAVDKNGNIIGTKVEKAGLVEYNRAEIRNCANDVKVEGSTDYIGGIAAIQESGALIANCVVNGKVCTASADNTSTTLGGIVGKATGSVTDCTYEYGITLDQRGGKAMGNIVGAKGEKGDLKTSGNGWSTENTFKYGDENTDQKSLLPTDKNVLGEDVVNKYEKPFADVIDQPLELVKICDGKNKSNPKINDFIHTGNYRVADDFEITEEMKWDPFDTGDDNKSLYQKDFNLTGSLDGNNKTITTNGRMIFQNIYGTLKDLTVKMNASIEGKTTQSDFASAPLAKQVTSVTETLSNGQTYSSVGYIDNVEVITANNDIYVSSPNPAGVISGAGGGSTVNNCRSQVKLKIKVSTEADNTSVYAGGIVSQVSQANITNCKAGKSSSISIDENCSIGSNIKVHFYAGGIIGGLNWDGQTVPSVVTDNSCHVTKPFELKNSENIDCHVGAIIGKCGCASKDVFKNVADNYGNWWYTDWNPVGFFVNSTDVFAPRNSFEPSYE